MKDQVDALNDRGIMAAAWNSMLDAPGRSRNRDGNAGRQAPAPVYLAGEMPEAGVP